MYKFYFTDFQSPELKIERLRNRVISLPPNGLRSNVEFPEAQLIHGLRIGDNITLNTNGLMACSAIAAGFVRAEDQMQSAFMSHTTPGMETDAIEALVSAIAIATDSGYELSYLAKIGPRTAEYSERQEVLEDLVNATVVGTAVRPIFTNYKNPTGWQLQAESGSFMTTVI